MKPLENARWIAAQCVQRWQLLRGPLAILMYHRVCEPTEHPWLERAGVPRVAPAVFAEQMAFLAAHAFRVLPLEEAVDRLERRERLPPRSVVVTFDDGYRDNLTNALPVLERHGFPATLFVATDALDEALLFEHLYFAALDRLGPQAIPEATHGLQKRIAAPAAQALAARLRPALAEGGFDEAVTARSLYLRPAELAMLEARGMSLGSHGAAHLPHAAFAGADELRADLERARDRLRALVRQPSTVYGSPYGSHRPRDLGLLRALGYRAAVSVRFGTNRRREPRHFLRRIALGDRSWHRLHFLERRAHLAARLDRWRP